MPPPPSGPLPSSSMIRSSSEAQGREKELPRAPAQISRTSSEPATYLPLRGPPNFGDPRTREEQREAARRAAEEEERATRREEAVRQARIKAQRAAEAEQAEVEERARRARVEHDMARTAAVREAREVAERLEEERRERERDERRLLGAERRAQAVRRLEEFRLEEERRREELARAEEEIKRVANERREAARLAAAKRRRESHLPGDSVLLSGWVTVQHSESVAWRRRYFQLTDTAMRLYSQQKVSGPCFAQRDKSPNGRTQDTGGAPLDVVVLKDTGPSIREWYEGYEELRSIPHAFALVFATGESPVMLFSDTALEKVRSLLYEFLQASLIFVSVSGFAHWPLNDMSMIVRSHPSACMCVCVCAIAIPSPKCLGSACQTCTSSPLVDLSWFCS